MSQVVQHVPSPNSFPLPAPSTSRNLPPRFTTTAFSRVNTTSSISQPSTFRAYFGSHMPSASNSVAQRGSSSRATKKRRTSRRPGGRVRNAEQWLASDEEDQVDQLISDNEQPPSQSVGEPSSQQSESQVGTYRSSATVTTTTGEVPSTTPHTFVSSPSLAKILHPVDVERRSFSEAFSEASTTGFSQAPTAAVKQTRYAKPSEPEPQHEPLSAYTCPICFFPPTNATIAPCGHICCGSCLFTAVRTTMQRGAAMGDGNVAR